MCPIGLLAALLATSLTAAPRPDARSPYRHVRSTQERTQQLLDLGSRRSSTFARLRSTLERTDVIVYVQAVNRIPMDLEGRLVFLTTANGRRYLRIDVRASLPVNDLIASIGHELQHAVEVATAGDVRDPWTMAGLYRRIGVSRTANTGFDTDAARAAGWRVKAELLGA